MKMVCISMLSKISSFINMLSKAKFQVIYSKLMRYNRFAYYQLNNEKGYQKWCKLHYAQIERDTPFIVSEIEKLKYTPLISILLILDEREKFWINTILSITNQLYTNWQLCVAIKTSTSLDILSKISIKNNSKIHKQYINKTINKGIILNNLLRTAKGKYILVLKAGDELPSYSLFSYVKTINLHKNSKIIYSDEDRIDKNSRHIDPFFKPQFSRELLYSLDYMSRGSLLKAEIVSKISGFREDLENCHTYELILKLITLTTPKEIYHIPKILYNSRIIYGEGNGQNISDAITSCQIIEEKLYQDNFNVKTIPFKIDNERIFHKTSIYAKPNFWPKVSIIIPTKDKPNLIKTCIQSIKLKTSYPDYEIIIVDNQSSDPEVLDYFKSINDKNNSIKIIEYNYNYNYSAINNYAVDFATGSIICFLNNDTEIINCNWLEEMVGCLIRPGVGVVGAKLYYPISNQIQHAGLHVALNPYLAQNGNHIVLSYGHQSADSNGYLNNLYLVQNLCSVVGACMLVKKEVFTDIGGFDEKNTPTSYSEVDLCFRFRKKGYRIVWTPYAELYHYEGASRGLDIHKSKLAHNYMIKKWAKYFENDPYVNSNLSFYYKNYPILLIRNKISPN